MNIKVTTDSTCDLPAEYLKKYGITTIPLHIISNDHDYLDGISITPQDIFRSTENEDAIFTTASANADEYHTVFERYAARYDGIVHVSLSSELSGSYSNACLAAADFPNVKVVDSLNLSSAQGMVAIEAGRLKDTCRDISELCGRLTEFVPHIECSFLISQFHYLTRSGRCSSLAALGANILNLKPCIQVIDGKMKVVKKYRGSFERCLARYLKDRLSSCDHLKRDLLMATRTVLTENETRMIDRVLESCGPFGEVLKPTAGCSISCHCGPGTMGVAFVRE